MKRIFIAILLFVSTFIVASTTFYYVKRDSKPVILCTSFDDSIRPRDYCLMNPFRDNQPEILAEEILIQLKNGNPNSIHPYLSESSEDGINHFVENETKYRVENWRIGNRKDSIDKSFIMYWVSRKDYFDGHIENVSFSLAKEGGNWKLKQFNAVY